MQANPGLILLWIVVAVVAIAVVWWLLARLYQRPTSEQAFVRTGFLGRKVAIGGGALVIPVLHEVTRVNLNVMRIGLAYRDADALITQDRLRLNIEADFFTRVQATADSVAAAARTLGGRTQSVDGMRQLLEARFSDALRTAAAEATMEALHENRSAYARRVRELAAQGLQSSGLELDGVSISKLDQAAREFFDPNNAFDAAGLTKLTAEIEERRRRRNEIERDTQVAIRRKNLATEQQMLELQREEEYARLAQERDIAVRRASEQSQISVESSELRRSSEVAEVGASQAVEQAKLVSERTVREERVRLQQQLRRVEIEQNLAVELAETQRREQLELAQQRSEIEVAQQSQQRSAALAAAEAARAQAVKAEEAVITAREIERAEREKALHLVAAARNAQASGLAVVEQAQAEQDAAERRAHMMKTLSGAEAQAEERRIAVADKRHEVEARARRALNEAENTLLPAAVEMRLRLAALERIEAVVRESAKPLEHVSDIKIVHVDGLSGATGGSAPADAGASASLSDQVMTSALKYRVQAPLVDALLGAAGVSTDVLHAAAQPRPPRGDDKA